MTQPPQGWGGATGPQDGTGGSDVPVCPRHPDRVSYIRCQRCRRPACPECQRSAAVGVQCVDCLREQAKGERRPVTVLGGRAGADKPYLTMTIIAIILAAALIYLELRRVKGEAQPHAGDRRRAAGRARQRHPRRRSQCRWPP